MRIAMASLLLRSTLIFAFAIANAVGQELPKKTGLNDVDLLEPKLMLNDVPDAPLPGSPDSGDAKRNLPPADVAKLEASLERAKRNAAMRVRLCKAGVLSKLEAEQGEMKVVQLTKDLANARLAAAKRNAEERHKEPAEDDASKKAVEAADAQVTDATTVAQEATTKWEQAQRAAAEIRVQRERMLMAMGAGSKASLKRAEAALNNLINPNGPASPLPRTGSLETTK